jgi:hypothetical protein
MTTQAIDTALLQGLQSLALTDPGGSALPIAWPNEPFDPPEDGSDWAATFQLPAPTETASLGVGGWNRLRGVLQVDLNTKPGTGTSTVFGYVDQILALFVPGKDFASGGQSVKVRQVDRSSIREIDGWARVSVSISWQALTIRPAI